MTKYLEQIFIIQCKGRDPQGKEALTDAVEVKVNVHQNQDSNSISSNVECMFNTGGSGQRCTAYNPVTDKIGKGIICPYSFDIPYALEHLNK